jgi:hypothetical protein
MCQRTQPAEGDPRSRSANVPSRRAFLQNTGPAGAGAAAFAVAGSGTASAAANVHGRQLARTVIPATKHTPHTQHVCVISYSTAYIHLIRHLSSQV